MSAVVISFANFQATAAQIAAAQIETDPRIGMPLLHSDRCNYRTGYICGIKNEMLQIVWDDEDLQQASVNYYSGFQRYINAAVQAGINNITPAEAVDKLAKAEQILKIKQEAKMLEREEAAQREAEWDVMITKIIPDDAQAVIVAELMQDESDTMSDYFSGSVVKTVILAFSSHKRDIFSEMRKAAKNDERTAFLATASKSAEHREKYSMGAGYYLSEGSRYSGWQIRKLPFYGKTKRVPAGEICKALQISK